MIDAYRVQNRVLNSRVLALYGFVLPSMGAKSQTQDLLSILSSSQIGMSTKRN